MDASIAAIASSLAALNTEPDLHPIYPSPASIEPLLAPHSGLSPPQKAQLVSHSLLRACAFGDLPLLSYLLADRYAQQHIDLAYRDEEGLGLVSLTIHGFGAESERDVEREECVRLLISQGADMGPDNAGWTPLHHAALLSPPSLISHLMTHGCSPFDVTKRNLTPLDIVTAHSLLPGREIVALILEESMRGEGWSGGRVEQRRKIEEAKALRENARKEVRDGVGRTLDIDPKWWSSDTDSDDDPDEDSVEEGVYSPPLSYANMLVFSPPALPDIFESLITNFPTTSHDAQPANTLYMLARFASLTCDSNWLEDLIFGAVDTIEDTFFARADDIASLVFWLFNTTVWLHLMRCDESINEACDILGAFEIIEEVINSLYVFIIRFAERKIDSMLDAALLDYSPLGAELDSVRFESEWSILRAFGKKATAPSASTSNRNSLMSATPSSPRPISDSFQSIRQSMSRQQASTATSTTPRQKLFSDNPPAQTPESLTSFLSALHAMLTLSCINPALITQLWSQVFYWTSCEMFNRILTRKKHLCRSRALQVALNLGVLEEWACDPSVDLPRGVLAHFAPVHDLLNWLQCLSSIAEFPSLVATIQAMKHINPLQMRRAVRDYRYEVNEGRMTEECIQYLTQLQKDWERHRVKVGVEALRKEMGDREREREESAGSSTNDDTSSIMPPPSLSSTTSIEGSAIQQGIDMLFERSYDKHTWEPAKPPEVLGELLDSRHMLPLVFPSDPRLLGVFPGKLKLDADYRKGVLSPTLSESRSASRMSNRSRGGISWRARNKKLREMSAGTLRWVDGAVYAARWSRPLMHFADEEEEVENGDLSLRQEGDDDSCNSEELREKYEQGLSINTHSVPLTRARKSSVRKGRHSHTGDLTPIDRRAL